MIWDGCPKIMTLPRSDCVLVTGRAPGSVVGDRGFGTVANDRALVHLVAAGGLPRRLPNQRQRRDHRLMQKSKVQDD
jgi:hypothetical protein